MGSFLRENLCSESFPNFDGKFIQGGDSGNKGDTGRPCDSEIELLTDPVIGNIFYPFRKPRWTFCGWCCFCALRNVSGNASEMKVPDPTLDWRYPSTRSLESARFTVKRDT